MTCIRNKGRNIKKNRQMMEANEVKVGLVRKIVGKTKIDIIRRQQI